MQEEADKIFLEYVVKALVDNPNDVKIERTVDEKELDTNEVDDMLYVVRTRVTWGTGEDQCEELVRYVRQLEGESEKKK